MSITFTTGQDTQRTKWDQSRCSVYQTENQPVRWQDLILTKVNWSFTFLEVKSSLTISLWEYGLRGVVYLHNLPLFLLVHTWVWASKGFCHVLDQGDIRWFSAGIWIIVYLAWGKVQSDFFANCRKYYKKTWIQPMLRMWPTTKKQGNGVLRNGVNSGQMKDGRYKV